MKILVDCSFYVIMGWYVKKKGDKKEYVSKYNRLVIVIFCKFRLFWSSFCFND